MHVRPARPEDAAALAAVHLETWRGAYRGIMPDAVLDGLRLERFERNWREQLANPARTNLVCESSGRLVGFAALGPCRAPDLEGSGVGELYALYVHPDHWGERAGWLLWTTAAAALRARGHEEVVLWVLEANVRARRFYERAGFRLEPEALKQYEREGVSLPEVRYRMRFPPAERLLRLPSHGT